MGASPGLRRLAKSMRSNATEAERRLWYMLRGHRLGGLKFRRQVPMGGYIVDFVCLEARLIVEADSNQHMDVPGDAERDRHFAAAGFRTLRFWNHDILFASETVAGEILRVARSRT